MSLFICVVDSDATCGGGCVVIQPLTKHGAGGRFEGLTVQTPPIYEVTVGGAGVSCEAARPVQSTQVQKHRALVVAHKVRFT